MRVWLVTIGEPLLIISENVCLYWDSGGTQIGEYTWIAPSACLRDRIKIGNKSTIGLASVVTKDIPDDVTVMGSPAREIGEQKKLLTHWADVVAKADKR